MTTPLQEPAMLHVEPGRAQEAVATLLQNEAIKQTVGFASSEYDTP